MSEQEQTHPPQQMLGMIYQDQTQRGLCWYAVWWDHAGRLIRRNIGTVKQLGDYLDVNRTIEPMPVKLAALHAAQKYIERHKAQLAEKLSMAPEHLLDLEYRAVFPREPVAKMIIAISDRIGMDMPNENRGEQYGRQLFIDRLEKYGDRGESKNGEGISDRELKRLLEDDSRMTASRTLVDTICCEFDMLWSDFVDECRDWADKKGRWADRFGTQDEWPVGYSVEPTPEIPEVSL